MRGNQVQEGVFVIYIPPHLENASNVLQTAVENIGIVKSVTYGGALVEFGTEGSKAQHVQAKYLHSEEDVPWLFEFLKRYDKYKPIELD